MLRNLPHTKDQIRQPSVRIDTDTVEPSGQARAEHVICRSLRPTVSQNGDKKESREVKAESS